MYTGFSPLQPSQLVGFNAGSVNIIGIGYGNWDWGRWAQIKGTYKIGKIGRVSLALVDPNGAQRTYNDSNMGDTQTDLSNFFPADTVGAVLGRDYQNNTKLPDLNLSAILHFGPISVYPGFLYQYRTVDYLNSSFSEFDDSVATYAGSLGVKGGFGPFGFAAEGNWGQNVGNTRSGLGASPSANFTSATFNEDGYMNNANTLAYWGDVWYKFGPVTPHLMGGVQKSTVDYNFRSYDISTWFWGFSIPIDLAKGLSVRPEFMWYDDGDLEAGGTNGQALDFGRYSIYGVQFQITF